MFVTISEAVPSLCPVMLVKLCDMCLGKALRWGRFSGISGQTPVHWLIRVGAYMCGILEMNVFLREKFIILLCAFTCSSYGWSDESIGSIKGPVTAIYYSGFDVLRPMAISEESIENNSCRVFVGYFEIEDYLQKETGQSVGYNSKDISLKIVSGKYAYFVDRNRVVRVDGADSDGLLRFDKDKFILNYGELVKISCEASLNKSLER